MKEQPLSNRNSLWVVAFVFLLIVPWVLQAYVIVRVCLSGSAHFLQQWLGGACGQRKPH